MKYASERYTVLKERNKKHCEKADVPAEMDLNDLTGADKWILSKVNHLAKEVTENLDKYELGIAVQKVYDFIWEEFCDWYIEMVKPRLLQ